MKKEEKKQEQQESSVRTYFTPEVNKQISEMTMKEMESVLKEMISSRQWIAILKYVSTRALLLDSQLRSTNPTADPHTISWAQGAMAGIYDIENYIIDLNAPKPEAEEEENDNYEPEGKI